MSWMVPSLIATIIGTLALTTVYYYTYIQYRERFMRLWALSWTLYSVRLGLELLMLFAGALPALQILTHIANTASGLYLILGSYVFVGKRFSKIWIYAGGFAILWAASAVLFGLSFLYTTLPVFLFLAAVYISTGRAFLRTRNLLRVGRIIVGWSFIGWGIHKINYPFIRPIEWLAPWGYLLAALFSIAVAIGILLIYYQKMRDDLMESNERFRSMFNNNHAVMMLIDPATGNIVDANPAACEYYGWSRERLMSMKITDINTLPQEQVFAEMQKAKREKRNHFYFRHRLANGSERDVEVYSGPINTKEGTLLYSIVHDVTRRIKAEERLNAAMIQLNALIENMRDGILFENRDRRIVFVNSAFCRIFGIRAEPGSLIGADSRGAVFMSALLFPSPEIFAKRVEDLVNGELTVTDEMLTLTDGRVLERDAFPIYSHGQYLGHLWQYRDVTERKSLQDQLRHAQKMEAIGTLAGGVAHDFNNIITAIVGYGNLLKMNLKNDEQNSSYLEQILASADRAATLTRSLLAFSRKQPASFQIINVEEVVRRVLNLLRRLIGEDIELVAEFSSEALTVFADTVHIEQMLMNLATNARDAMPGGGRLTIKTGCTTIDNEFRKAHNFGRPGEYAFITVSDTGIGIDEKIKDRIFEPFFTTKETGKGTGLGLAVVYGIVKQHNGYIVCDSTPDRGTTFTIYLPIVCAEIYKNEQKPVPRQYMNGSETLLLAEDDADVRRLTRTVLEEFGYKVIEAQDGEDAIEKIRANGDSIRLAILDVVMPKKSGIEAYEEIQRLFPGIKALFMSGYADTSARFREVLGQNDWLIQKPISPGELLKKVREVLDNDRN